MNRWKYALTALSVTALGVLSVAVGGEAFAQGMGAGGPMMGGGSMVMQNRGGVNWPDTLEVVAVSGVALVERNSFHDRYALDTDGDGSADYQLSFGPWWYEPESGAVRPSDGTSVTIKGGVYSISSEVSLLVAFEINELPWRDQGELLPWSGGWMHEDVDTTFFHAPMDSLNWMGFPSGVMGDLRERMMGMMGGGMAPDSAYFHFEAVDPEHMPGPVDSSMVAGYHVGFSDPWGSDLMGDEMGMNFSHGIEMHLHYDADEAEPGDFSGRDMVLMTLSRDAEWVEVADAEVNAVENTVSLTSGRVSAYYGLFSRTLSPTAVEEEAQGQTPADFALLANFPNPFNAETVISYNLAEEAWVKLEIINALGQPIRTLVDGSQRAGYASVHWDGRDDAGRDLASGMYLSRLKISDRVEMRKLLLLR